MRATVVSSHQGCALWYCDQMNTPLAFVAHLSEPMKYGLRAPMGPAGGSYESTGYLGFRLACPRSRTAGAVLLRDDHMVLTVVAMCASSAAWAQYLLDTARDKAAFLGFAFTGVPQGAELTPHLEALVRARYVGGPRGAALSPGVAVQPTAAFEQAAAELQQARLPGAKLWPEPAGIKRGRGGEAKQLMVVRHERMLQLLASEQRQVFG